MERMKAILVLTAAIAFAVAPLISPPFAGYRPDQFPVPQPDPLIQPPGWTFSVWLVIYAWLIVSAVYGLTQRAEDAGWDRTRWPLFLSLCFGTAWLPVATVSPFWATVLIWAMLAGALAALLRAPREENIWLAAPLGLFAGWLTAAACVSLAITLTGFGAGSQPLLHPILLGVAIVIGAVTLLRRAEPFYALGLGWALIGVFAANIAPPQWVMMGLATLGLVLLAILTFPGRRTT